MTLTEFLLARIAEDEEAAQGVNRGLFNSRVALLPPDLYGLVIRQHPARVLAECEAKRRIVRDHEPIIVWPDGTGGAKFYTGQKLVCTSCADGPTAEVPCRTLKFLALPYSDHPDYDESWRP